ncbi:MAG: DUF4236 domain-containing protein, partial [Cyanobium sp.]
MGFRLRRSARLGPLRFNFSSGGLSSISVGGRGASFNIPVSRSARARETHWQLRGYSRLLDLERLLFVIRLLSRYPELDAADPITREQLEAIVSPLPSGDLAERAAAFMRRLHRECYGDVGAICG